MWYLLLACHLPGSSSKAAEPPKPMDVELTSAQKQPMPRWLPLTGSILAARQVQVAANAAGVVTSVRVERGQKVQKGQVLAEVDTRLSRLTANAGDAQAEALKVQLSAAEQDCARSEKLYQDGVIPQAAYDRSAAGCLSTRRSLEAAEASADAARTNLANTSIRAPFDGVVSEKLVEVGAFVQNPTPVVTLVGEGAFRVRFSVPESYAASVAEGQAALLSPSTRPELELPAVVRYISPSLREPTRDRVVEADIQGSDPGILPGMFALVRLSLQEQEQVVVPEAAVRTEGSVHRLYTVSEGRAFERVVQLGSHREGWVVITQDLVGTEQVILSPPLSLRDGQAVE